MRYLTEALFTLSYYLGVFWLFITGVGLIVLALVLAYYWIIGEK